jgi:hypothetical protein
MASFIIGYFACALIGLSLGLIGGGGSILTIPVLVYLFNIDAVLASSYSLFVVGTTSLIGAFLKMKEGNLDFKTALLFGLPSLVTVYLTRHLILPAIPATVFVINEVEIKRSMLMLVLFAVVMIAASLSMIRNSSDKAIQNTQDFKINYVGVLLRGVFIGLMTGLIGAGGGFLIIPALVIFLRIPMKKAIGTSLLIIASNCLFGFTADLQHFVYDWNLLITVTIISIAGILLGNQLSKKLDGNSLKKGFGYFVLITGLYVIIRELFFL